MSETLFRSNLTWILPPYSYYYHPGECCPCSPCTRAQLQDPHSHKPECHEYPNFCKIPSGESRPSQSEYPANFTPLYSECMSSSNSFPILDISQWIDIVMLYVCGAQGRTNRKGGFRGSNPSWPKILTFLLQTNIFSHQFRFYFEGFQAQLLHHFAFRPRGGCELFLSNFKKPKLPPWQISAYATGGGTALLSDNPGEQVAASSDADCTLVPNIALVE